MNFASSPHPTALTNALRQKYASLAEAKHRRATGLFMAQGTKCVTDTLEHFSLECLLCTEAWFESHNALAPSALVVKKQDLAKISTMTSVPDVIAVYHIPVYTLPDIAGKLTVALDCVQDPGNLGTIMRVADWMGITDIIASHDTADVWSPKVVQATMGAISRVRVHYVDLPAYLAEVKGLPVYGTFLDGDDIYRSSLSSYGIIVMGNEGRGISPLVAEHVSHRLLIPSYPPGRTTSESLNVAVATAITLSEFRRNG